MKRHKIFISYHHANDQYYKEQFEYRFCHLMEACISRSVGMGDIADNLPVETIRQKVRDKFLRDATVTVVLIGKDSWRRKYVDWEISSSIKNTEYNPRAGLLGIFLPTHPDYGRDRYNRYLIPPRLYYNADCGFATLHDWTENTLNVQQWIHSAFQRRNQVSPIQKPELFRNNRPISQMQWQP